MARRLFTGKDGSAWKFRISKPGYDAKTETNQSRMQFDADWPDMLEIHAIVPMITPTPSPGKTYKFTWPALPFIPLCMTMYDGAATFETVGAWPGIITEDTPVGTNGSTLLNSFFSRIDTDGLTIHMIPSNYDMAAGLNLGTLYVFNNAWG